MPSDHLTLGEELRPGEYIVSKDGRFRLYLEESGELVAFAYSTTRGIQRYWRNGVEAGENAVARFEYYSSRSGVQHWPALSVFDARGSRVWMTRGDATYNPRLWHALYCVIHPSGNIGVYAESRNHDGVVRSSWASGTYGLPSQQAAVQPNATIVLLPSPGTVAVSDGNFDIVNNTDETVGVVNGAEYLGVLPGESAPAYVPSTLSIETVVFPFDDERGPNGSGGGIMTRHANAICDPPPAGSRGRIEIGTGGSLRLQGLMLSPDGRELTLLGSPIPVDPELEFDGENQVPRQPGKAE